MEHGYEIWLLEYGRLYRAGSLMTVLEELSKFKLDLMGAQVNRDVSGFKQKGSLNFLWKGK
jgi:hypothetical protein